MNRHDVRRLYKDGLMCSLDTLVHGRLYIIRQLWQLPESSRRRLPRLLVQLQREDTFYKNTWLHLPRRYGRLFCGADLRAINRGWVNNGLVYWGRRENGEHAVEFRWDRCDWADGGANIGNYKWDMCKWCGE
jgi:hypothetical protein